MKKVLITLSLLASLLFAEGFDASFYELQNSKKQKEEFIKALKPLLQRANENILNERNFIEAFYMRAISIGFREFESSDLAYIINLAKKYKIATIFHKNEFLRRIDVVPVSLGLTQGAIESAWGRSRFAREANNIFGHWTWGEYGLVPEQREEGKTHKIRIFSDLQASVDAYVLNLNRNQAYKEFRHQREVFRQKGELFNGFDAALSMKNYSELKEDYVWMLQGMMEKNNLLAYDNDAVYNPASLMASD
ncbi:MAG: glucosaminidase domain-containing protein [Sulfurospirillum sp.]|nr:glucosaminidase domain-containing protein [Sulfurospirillum sp.]